MRSRGFLGMIGLSLGLALTGVGATIAQDSIDRIGEIRTSWNGQKVIIEGFDDPMVPGIACHLSRSEKGGIGGFLGLANDTSDASLACRQIGPVTVDLGSLSKMTETDVFSAKTHWLFKTMHVRRFPDVKRNTIVYITFSDAAIEGSHKTAISSVPVMPWRP